MGRHKLDINTTERRCVKCHEVKPLTDFYAHKGMPLHRSYSCKSCDKADRVMRYMELRGADALLQEIQRDEVTLARKKRVLFLLTGRSI